MRRQASQTSQDLDAEGWCEIQIVPEDGPDATQDEGKQQHVGSETPVSRNPRNNNNKNIRGILSESIALSELPSRTNGKLPPDPDSGSTHSDVSGSFSMVNTVVLDVMDKYKGRKERRKTLFYHFVQGGDTEMVSEVLRRLEEDGNTDTRNWLIGAQVHLVDYKSRTWSGKLIRGLEMAGRIAVVLVMVCLSVLLSPIVYSLHACCVALCDTYRKDPSEKKEPLPLVFAALSECEEMLCLFKEEGANISQVDDDGNNVFHYLANISKRNHNKSCASLRALMNVFDEDDDMEALRDVVLKQRNQAGLTAFESVIRYGSPMFLNAVVDTDGLIKKTVMRFSGACTWISLQDADISEREKIDLPKEYVRYGARPSVGSFGIGNQSNAEQRKYVVNHYDVTQYEGQRNIGNSSVLQMLSIRSISDFSKMEMEALQCCGFFRKWVSMKIREMMWLNWGKHALSVLVTVLLVLTVSKHPAHIAVPLKPIFQAISENPTLINGSLYIEPHVNISDLNDTAVFGPGSFCQENVTTVGGVTLDSCQSQAFDYLYNACPRFMENATILSDSGLLPSNSEHLSEFQIRVVLLILVICWIVVDLITRLLFLVQSFSFIPGSMYNSLFRILSISYPGSYVEKQLEHAFVTTFVFYFVASDERVALSGKYDMLTLQNAVGTSMVVMLAARFLCLIWTMRLFPYVGHFILSGAAMGRNLLQFLFVYVLILIAIGVIFVSVAVDLRCPSVRPEAFRTASRSALEVYQLMMGGGEVSQYASVGVLMAYLLYLALTILLLLNLFSSILGRTTDVLVSGPVRHMLQTQQRLIEAIDTEGTLQILTLTLWGRLKRKIMGRVGFKFDRTADYGNLGKVCIEERGEL